MKAVSMIGSFIVTLALVFYSIGFTKERKERLVTSKVLTFFTIGVILDITATALMIIGSSNGAVTIHGMIGYSALLAMGTDTALLWRHNVKQGPSEQTGKNLHLYSRYAYFWWVLAYITGGVLIAISKIG